jgi:hypothetical protein
VKRFHPSGCYLGLDQALSNAACPVIVGAAAIERKENAMTTHKLQMHRPYPTLTKLTIIGLVGNGLAFASELIWLGHLDREVSIVVACLIAGSLLVATGWRWTPLVGVVLAGGLFFCNPFLLYNLSQPMTNAFFFSAVAEVISGLLVVVAGVGATVQNYWQNYRNTKRSDL